MDTASGLTLIPEIPRNIMVLQWKLVLMKSGDNGVWVEDPVCPQIHPMIIFPVPEYIIRIGIFRIWKNSHTGSLSYGVRTIMVEKVKWKPL